MWEDCEEALESQDDLAQHVNNCEDEVEGADSSAYWSWEGTIRLPVEDMSSSRAEATIPACAINPCPKPYRRETIYVSGTWMWTTLHAFGCDEQAR